MKQQTMKLLFGFAIGQVAMIANATDAVPATTTEVKPINAEVACVKNLDALISEIKSPSKAPSHSADQSQGANNPDTQESTRETLDRNMKALSALTVAQARSTAPDQDSMVKAAVSTAADAVQTGANQMARLDELWRLLGNPKTVTQEFLGARRRIADCADVVFTQATGNAKVATIMAKDQQASAMVETALAHTRRDYVYVAQEQNYDEAQVSLFTGPTLSLNGDDKFKTGFEVSALFDGGAGSAFGFGRFFSDFTYQTKGSVQMMAEMNGSVGQPGANQLFREDKGYLKFNVGASTAFGDSGRYSVFASTGLSTIPGTGGDFPQALRPRAALGLLSRSFVSEGMYARLSMSVAHDEYWTTATGNATDGVRIINSYERGVVEALVLVPQLSASGVTLSSRVGLDTPLDGKGPSEVRLSVLASVNFGDFLKKIINLPAAP